MGALCDRDMLCREQSSLLEFSSAMLLWETLLVQDEKGYISRRGAKSVEIDLYSCFDAF
jgi:hypothetical protein